MKFETVTLTKFRGAIYSYAREHKDLAEAYLWIPQRDIPEAHFFSDNITPEVKEFIDVISGVFEIRSVLSPLSQKPEKFSKTDGAPMQISYLSGHSKPVTVSEPEDIIKQVIVMRTDLNMRKGKMIAQGAHAAMAFLISHATIESIGESMGFDALLKIQKPLKHSYEAVQWMKGQFTKVCVQVGSEDELHQIYQQAQIRRLTVNIIQDSGKTEFDGVPTYTCLAIGPNKASEIDKITGHLKLL